MTVDLVLHNAKLRVPTGVVDGSLAVDGGRIFKIGKRPNLPSASSTVDLDGCLLLPGVIDVHVHLRDQQQSYKEDFHSGTAAAAAGGVTSVIDMPNNIPVTMSVPSLKDRMSLAERRIFVNVAFYSAFPESLGDMASIVEAGAVGFKLFLNKNIGGVNPNNDEDVLKAFKKVKETNVPVAVHAEDTEEMSYEKIDRDKDLKNFLKAHSTDAELKGVKYINEIVKKSFSKVHFCHITSQEGLNAVLEAKKLGYPVTFEVTPHHLFLCLEDLKHRGNMLVTHPPLRSKIDVETLKNALCRGLIDIVASDHAPHTSAEKEGSSVWDVKPGVVGLETMLPLLLTAVNNGELPIDELIELTSLRPAKIFGLKERGGLIEGFWADFIAVDLHETYRINASRFYSKSKFSPFDGWEVRGKPVKTFVNGTLVMDDGEVVAEPGAGHVYK